MPTYDLHCSKCNKTVELYCEIKDRAKQKCSCGTTMTTVITPMRNALDPFKPYVLENGVPDPILISSREQRNQIFKDRKIEQLSYKNRKYHPYSRIFPVSGSVSKGSGTRWTGAGMSY